ncbi:Avt1p ASCRUDRAFT_34883 [Ascoidea rubescens DSM 1968]|uniref:Amino acid transporter transmembrane domain-containing protein n=1 Tax=Ascoidea rubescens DSM 1968 TaxID=1344418 RepID=A0A1D2VHK7_9ASCO|nr:hypothetical protein ASCRUDRAFT_34883 [Ascoidea rubescens DSM 1968]ODV60993.1 hypothetical protein ASCRUDRAFT_34883 [Ascoidea rubescens DSM 1968]
MNFYSENDSLLRKNSVFTNNSSNLNNDNYNNLSTNSPSNYIVGSIGRFASSYTRAQSFKFIEGNISTARSYFVNGEDEVFDPKTLAPSVKGQRLSSYDNVSSNDEAIDDQSIVITIDNNNSNTFNNHNPMSSIMGRNFRTNSVYSRFSIPNTISTINDQNSLLINPVHTNTGKVVPIIQGQSTSPQTVFNSINVLIGIGLLALPLGLQKAGLIIGLPLLFISAFSTFQTAKLLSACMDTDPTLMTYADLGYATFGKNGRALISVLFSLDLISAGVALIALFADSLNALFPNFSKLQLKILAFCILTPPTFLPLSVLSIISLLGISSTILIVIFIFIAGLIKPTSPGSLISIMPINLYPQSLPQLLLALGILMAPWSGHAVFPNLKNDMRFPSNFKNCLSVTYIITFLTDFSMSIIGVLMFGNQVKEEITKSILITKGYPKFIHLTILSLIAMVPIAKTPLNARPIISILDYFMNLNEEEIIDENDADFSKSLYKKIMKIFNRVFVNFLFVIIAIIYPQFDKILALMGSALCFLICLILPCLFYLTICKDSITAKERVICYLTIFISSILSIIGTIAALTVN